MWDIIKCFLYIIILIGKFTDFSKHVYETMDLVAYKLQSFLRKSNLTTFIFDHFRNAESWSGELNKLILIEVTGYII